MIPPALPSARHGRARHENPQLPAKEGREDRNEAQEVTADLCFMPATELVARYRKRELSPVETTRAVLDRIRTLNPKLNAYCLVDEEGALTAARASEARWAKGEPAGAVDGVPASIKDLVLAKGWPTLRGSKTVDPAGPWHDDAPATARLREAGAVLLGKTCTPEYGWKGVTDSALTGITRNPWNLERTPGGSSGGAAAQLAGGLGQLAVGTDGGGSIRIPCAFAGISGIKAQFGRVPAWPLSPMGTVAHIGPMARSIADVALMLNVLARPDPRDWFALPPDATDWKATLRQGIKGLRIAYSPRLGYIEYVDPEVEARVAESMKVLSDLGAHVEQIDPGFPDARDTFWVHWTGGAFNALRKLPREKFALLEPALRKAFEHGSRHTLAAYFDAIGARTAMGERMKRFHLEWDLLATPALAVPAFDVGRIVPKEPTGPADDWTWWTPFSYPFNLTQQPALSVPCGFTKEGLPVGLQLVAPSYREDLALRAAHAFQGATDHLRRPAI
jgi:aspartyl-tRNA(Asn)/glutamyl-tRNA(Gln) amidotransferase subunit A